MEFSYRISEAEYLNAAKLRSKGSVRFRSIKRSIIIWIAILAGIMVAMSYVQKSRQQSTSTQQETVESARAEDLPSRLIVNVGPLIIFVGIIAFVIFKGVPMQLRRRYRKDPAMQGQFTVKITSESISTENTAGTSSKTGWNIYDYWREGKGLILMVFQSGAAFPISLAGLSESQQDELRGILCAAIPKK